MSRGRGVECAVVLGLVLGLVLGGCGPGTDERPVSIPTEWSPEPSPTGPDAGRD